GIRERNDSRCNSSSIEAGVPGAITDHRRRDSRPFTVPVMSRSYRTITFHGLSSRELLCPK
ncbi:hypothetical protein AVEN_178962-1, partial [Araneus ventricosus]